jgi:hypothetical protein
MDSLGMVNWVVITHIAVGSFRIIHNSFGGNAFFVNNWLHDPFVPSAEGLWGGVRSAYLTVKEAGKTYADN